MLRRWLNSPYPIGCELAKRYVRMVQLLELRNGGVELAVETRAVADGGADDPDRRMAAVTRAIKEIWRAGRFRGRQVVGVLPPEFVWYRTMRLAPMPSQELPSAAHWQAAKELGMNAQVFKSSSIRLGTVRETGTQKIEVATIGAALGVLGNHADAIIEAGLLPVAIDAAPCAAARLLTEESVRGPGGNEPLMFVDIRAKGSVVAVAAAGEVKFLHTVGGGWSRVLDLLCSRIKLSPAQTQALSDALQAGAAVGAELAAQQEIAAEALAEGLADAWGVFGRELAREVSMALNHYCDFLGGAVPGSATMIGEGGAPAELIGALAESSGLEFHPVAEVLGAPWAEALGGGTDVGSWVVAAGLSLYHGLSKEMSQRKAS
jgi:Tfp pilus assembly PilM family ATPase